MGVEKLSKETEMRLREDFTFRERGSTKHYKKEILIQGGYDALENYGLTRKYFQKRYQISFEELEILFFLFGRSYFSKKDLASYPLSFGAKRFKNFMESGLIIQLTNAKPNTRGLIYCLSHQAKCIVRDFHRVLAGVKAIPTDGKSNPIFKPSANSYMKSSRKAMTNMRKRQLKRIETRKEIEIREKKNAELLKELGAEDYMLYKEFEKEYEWF